MVKPRGTRKQAVVLSSDDDEDSEPVTSRRPVQSRTLRSQALENHGDQAQRTRAVGARSKVAKKPDAASTALTLSSPQSSPKSVTSSPKGRRKKQAPVQPVTREKSLFTFFNKASQRQTATPPPASAASTPRAESIIDDDLIEDDDLDGSVSGAPEQPLRGSLPVRKRSRDAAGILAAADGEVQAGGSQKFIKTESGKHRVKQPTQQKGTAADTRPWVDRFGPRNVEELAVHKKKITDVRNWLTGVFESKLRQRLLVLKGPAGSAKTVTLSLLAKELGVELQEWRNPTSSYQSDDGFVSMAAQFEDFMARSGTFNALDIADASGTVQPKAMPAELATQKHAIVIEEFPGIISTTSPALRSFRNVIMQFLIQSTSSRNSLFGSAAGGSESNTPVILIISETLLTSTSASTDNFTAHRLLGHEILAHPATTVIEFNPIAPTILTKALDLIITKEARVSGRRTAPGKHVLKRLVEIGDIRSAVSSLEFLCVRGDDQDGWGDRVTFGKAKKAGEEKPLTKMESESLQMITQRESTLGIFHSVGKVVHNKRFDPPSHAPLPQPPHHLPQHRRSKAPEVEADSLLDELGTDIQTFVSALHENYALSCCGSTDDETLDSLNGCLDALSDADLLSPDRFSISSISRRTFQGTAADNLRQEETSFHVAVRGILFSLPHPVKRATPTTNAGKSGNKGTAYQMYFPTSLRLWRETEEMQGLLDMLVDKAQNGTLHNTADDRPTFRRRTNTESPGGVDTWRRTQSQQTSSHPSVHADQPPLLAGGSSARQEMLLERLPYLAKMHRSRTHSNRPTPIQKLTSFFGIGGPSAEEADDDDAGAGDAGPVARIAKTVKGGIAGVVGAAEGEKVEEVVERLVLSDDDISDGD